MISLLAQPVVDQLQSQLTQRISAFRSQTGRPPGLAVVLVGEDPASSIYVKNKGLKAQQLGIHHQTLKFPGTVSPDEVFAAVQRLNQDPTVDGILIQRPLPQSFNEQPVIYWVHPKKDVDAFHPENIGKLSLGLPTLTSCTPLGIMHLLKHYQIPVAGKTACVIGRSSIVGKPMATLLLQADATVIHCHQKSGDLKRFTLGADLLVVAAGKPGLITQEFIKPGATVIDVGIHRDQNKKITGDVCASVAKVAGALTPVPGGVGPMTIAMLLQNTVQAAEAMLVQK